MAKKPDIFWVSAKFGNGKRSPTIDKLALYEDGHYEVLESRTEATPEDLGFPDDLEFSLSPPPITPEEKEEEIKQMSANLSRFASERYSQGRLFSWQNGERPPETPPFTCVLDFSDLDLNIRVLKPNT